MPKKQDRRNRRNYNPAYEDVLRLLLDPLTQEQSDRAIARFAGVGSSAVQKLRHNLIREKLIQPSANQRRAAAIRSGRYKSKEQKNRESGPLAQHQARRAKIRDLLLDPMYREESSKAMAALTGMSWSHIRVLRQRLVAEGLMPLSHNQLLYGHHPDHKIKRKRGESLKAAQARLAAAKS